MHGQPLLAPHYLETSLSSIVQTPKRDRWAHLRFSIIGALLAAPPAPGCLMASLQALAAKPWRHPDTGLDIRFSAATLERWYYAARRGTDPVAVLRDRKRDNVGQFPSLNLGVARAKGHNPGNRRTQTKQLRQAKQHQKGLVGVGQHPSHHLHTGLH